MFPTPRARILPTVALVVLAFVVGLEAGGWGRDVSPEASVLLEAEERIRSSALRPPPEGALAREGVRGMLQALEDDQAAYLPEAARGGDVDELARRGLGLSDAATGGAEVRTRTLSEGVGHVAIPIFAPGTSDRVRRAVVRFAEDGLRAVVLDLRGNPGGTISEAVEVGAIFLGREPILLQEDADGRERTKAGSLLAVDGVEVVVLVDGGTASAAELVAGAIQDHAAGLVVGTRTKGKATIQRILALDDGSAIKLTTGVYRTPLGRRVDGQGIRPDVKVAEGLRRDAALDRAVAIVGAGREPS